MSPELKIENGNLVFAYLKGESHPGDNHKKHGRAHLFAAIAANFLRDLKRGARPTEDPIGNAVRALANFLPRETAKQIIEAAVSGKEDSRVTFTRDQDSESEVYTDVTIDIKTNPKP
jgi:hypothetical protein